MDSFYLYLSSCGSPLYYPNNKANNFTSYMGRNLKLEGSWFCALKEIYYEYRNTGGPRLYLCADICDTSYVGERELPVLRPINIPDQSRGEVIKESLDFPDGYYIPLNRNQFQTLKISLVDEDLTPAKDFTKVSCTLHLKKL